MLVTLPILGPALQLQ